MPPPAAGTPRPRQPPPSACTSATAATCRSICACTSARVDASKAALEGVSARYRQTVLTAFQDVEDQLVALRVLQQQQVLRQEASRAADLVEQQVLNRYQAGQVNYTEVVTAQVGALNARRALVQAQIDRQVAAVALVQALGGGWRGLGVPAAGGGI